MPKLKSERHHWWPRCVSRLWAADDGKVGWIKPDGSIVRAPPQQFGLINNGHQIRLSSTPGESSVWDESFEKEFDRADGQFPAVIDFLETLTYQDRRECTRRDRYVAQAFPEQMRLALVEGLVSLAVRSPQNREASVSLAEELRGPLPTRERNSLIGANMRNSQRIVVRTIGSRGKFAIIRSPDREFIFGDGFFHNILAVTNPPHNPTILAPLTPHLSVLFTLPMSYTVEPQLSTLVVTGDEALMLNETVQVYARQALFFRTETPGLTNEYKAAKHLRYAGPVHPITAFIHSLPGVPDRDSSLDALLAQFD
jgi:hypothetical protein